MPTFQIERTVIRAEGTQTFQVEASNRKEAQEKFENGKSKIVFDDCEVTDLSDWDWAEMYETE